MKKFLFALFVCVLVLGLTCCNFNSDDIAAKAQQLGNKLEATNPEKELTDEEIVAQAQELTRTLINEYKSVLLDINNYKSKSATEENHNKLVAVLKKFSDLAEKYSNNAAAWSAVRTTMRYMSVEDYPGNGDTNICGTIFDDTTNLAIADSASIDSNIVTTLITAARALTSGNGSQYAKWIMNGIPVSTPYISEKDGESIKNTTSVSFSDGNSHSITVSGTDGYSDDFIEVTYTSLNKSGNVFTGTAPVQEEEDKTITYQVIYKIKDKYKDVFVWDDDEGGQSRTLKMSIKTPGSNHTPPQVDTRTKITTSGETIEYNNESIKSNASKYFVEDRKIVFGVKSDPFDKSTLSVKVEGPKARVESISKGDDSFSCVINVEKPGTYTINYAAKAPDNDPTYKNSDDKKITITLKDSVKEVTDSLSDELTPVGVGLLASLYYENTLRRTFKTHALLSDAAESDLSFYNYLKSEYPNVSKGTMYLYSNLFPSLYFDEIIYAIDEIAGAISIDNSESSEMMLCKKDNYPDYFEGDKLKEVSAISLKEISEMSNSLGKIKTAFKDGYYSGYKALKEYNPTFVKLLNVLGCLNNPTMIIETPGVIEKLNWLIDCVKASVSYDYNLCSYEEKENSNEVQMVFTPSYYVLHFQGSQLYDSLILAQFDKDTLDEYFGNIPEDATDIEKVISDTIEKITHALDIRKGKVKEEVKK